MKVTATLVTPGPLATLLRDFAHRAWTLCSRQAVTSTLYPNAHNFSHHLFRHRRNGGTSVSDNSSTPDNAGRLAATTPVPTWQLEVLRLLTFEALEMTHTCCRAGHLHEFSNMAIFSHPDPEGARRRLSADPSEADKAWQLEELMAEFAEQLGRRSGSPYDLENFIFGSWRAQIMGLYDVNDQEMKAMEDVLGARVQTSELPFIFKQPVTYPRQIFGTTD